MQNIKVTAEVHINVMLTLSPPLSMTQAAEDVFDCASDEALRIVTAAVKGIPGVGVWTSKCKMIMVDQSS